MRRRQFLGLIGAGATLSLPSRAQQSGSPAKIGFLYPGPDAVAKLRSVPLLAGLASEGLHEPDQIRLLTRATGGDARQIGPLLNELLASKVDLLLPSGPAATSAVFGTTKSLPIVTFDLESDPVESGWLQSYAHPGGNLTGVFSDFPDFASKWLELLREIVPGLSYLVVLWDPATPMVQARALSAAAQGSSQGPGGRTKNRGSAANG